MTERTVTYGDTGVLRRRVDQLREQAVDLRGLADQMVARTDATGWTGRAAESMRLRVADRAAHLRAAAGDHETAAEALEAHLQEVDHVTDRIAAVQRRVAAMQADGDPGVAGLETPPPGHRDWLDLDLPGVSA